MNEPSLTALGTINGYPVIAAALTPGGRGLRPGATILVDRGEGSHDRYVVAWAGWSAQDGWDRSWCHGHYRSDFSDIWRVFTIHATRDQACALVKDPQAAA